MKGEDIQALKKGLKLEKASVVPCQGPFKNI